MQPSAWSVVLAALPLVSPGSPGAARGEPRPARPPMVLEAVPLEGTADLLPFPGRAVWSSAVVLDVQAAPDQRWTVSLASPNVAGPPGLDLRVAVGQEGGGPGWALAPADGVAISPVPTPILRGQGQRTGVLVTLTADARSVLRPGTYPLILDYELSEDP